MTSVTALSGAERLLRAERETLLPLLRQIPEEDFARPTVCTDWSVRDVIAHCGAALAGLGAGPSYRGGHDRNRLDVEERRPWPLSQVLDEYARSLETAEPLLRAAGGAKDLAAFGTWIHGGDVREGLGLDGAYHSAGTEDALAFLARCDRVTGTPQVRVTLPDRRLTLGSPVAGRASAALTTDIPTLFRLYTGRQADLGRYELSGARVEELVSAEW